MTDGLRIFISHSSKAEQATALREEFVAAFDGTHHLVLVDKGSLKPGDDWRSMINMWIGSCDVAIVLLSEEALNSPFVAYELSVLSYRGDIDERFALIPVVLRPVNYAAIQASRLAPTMVQRWEAVINEEDGGTAVADVLKRLVGLERRPTPLEKCTRKVRRLLQDVPDDVRSDQLVGLGVELPPWMPNDDLASRLAVTLLAAGLEASAPVIRRIREFLSKRDLINLIDVLACSWVDYRSVLRVPEAARDQRIIALNAADPQIARMYVVRAAIEAQDFSPADSWPFGADNARPEPTDAPPPRDSLSATVLTANELRRRVSKYLARALGVKPADLVAVLEEMRDLGEPVFVALPATALTADVLTELLRSLPGVAFFLLTGPERLRSELAPGAAIIEPELERGAEEQFRRAYRQRRVLLLRRPTSNA